MIPGRHYATENEGWRGFRVVRAVVMKTRRGQMTVYVTISRHWTWKGAAKAARVLNNSEAS